MTHLVRAVRSVRDLTVLEVEGGMLVVACDSVGGIGPKPADTVRVDGATTAHFATRVPVLEVLCAGATPTLVVDTLCVESDPAGVEMLRAVWEVAATVGLGPDRVTGTTEDNVVTTATALGVTVIGEVAAGGLRPGRSEAGDVVVCLGLPRSAPDHVLTPTDPETIAIADLHRLLGDGPVRDALPVGSRGLAWEVGQLAASAGLDWSWKPDHGLDVRASAGPATCVLVSCAPTEVATIRDLLPDGLPTAVVATLGQPEPEGAPRG